jgi:hypothetical protein
MRHAKFALKAQLTLYSKVNVSIVKSSPHRVSRLARRIYAQNYLTAQQVRNFYNSIDSYFLDACLAYQLRFIPRAQRWGIV